MTKQVVQVTRLVLARVSKVAVEGMENLAHRRVSNKAHNGGGYGEGMCVKMPSP